MDIGQVISVLRLSWDLPWRILASVGALSTTAGFFFGVTGLGFIALCSDWLGLTGAFSASLQDAQTWITERGRVLAPIGVMMFVAGLAFAGAQARRGSANRAPASALVGAWLAIESGYPLAALTTIALVVGLWLIAATWRAVLGYTSDYYIGDHGVALAETRLRRTWLSLIVAVLYIPAAPLSWMTRS